MEELFPLLFEIGFSVFLVLANFYFVAAEFAVVRARPTKLRDPEELKKFGGKSALTLIEDLDLSLSATQLGITVASLILGWIGEHAFAKVFLNLFSFAPPDLAFFLSHGLATTMALVLVTFLHVVIGELAAKSLAIRYPEVTLRLLAPLMLLLTKVFKPIIFFLNGAANLFLMVFGMRSVGESERVLSSAELAMLVSHSSRYGMLDKTEEEMLKGIFSFSETVAREVMTPRTDMESIPSDASIAEVLEIVTRSGYSRFPVIGERVDDVKGILLARDLLAALHDNSGKLPSDFSLERILRKAFFIPGTKQIDELLNELRAKNVHMAVVLDEHGGVDGVVTLEDLIEEIVGDIFDESDCLEEDIKEEDDGDLIIDGGVLVSDLNERFSLNLKEGDYDTIAGLVFSALGRIAEKGDSILINRFGRVMELNGLAAEESNSYSSDDHEQSQVLESRGEVPAESPYPEVLITVEEVVGNRINLLRFHTIAAHDEQQKLPVEEKKAAQLEDKAVEAEVSVRHKIA